MARRYILPEEAWRAIELALRTQSPPRALDRRLRRLERRLWHLCPSRAWRAFLAYEACVAERHALALALSFRVGLLWGRRRVTRRR